MEIVSWSQSAAPSFYETQAADLAPVQKKQGERRFVSLFPTIMSGIPGNWSADRYRQVNQYRDWPYVAINVAALEAAQLPPTVANVVSAEEKEEHVQKSLRGGGRRMAELAGRKYLSSAQRRKALIHTQGDDEVRPVDRSHPLVKLFKKPSPIDCYWTWAYKVSMYLDLTGVIYLWVVPNRIGLPCALWPIPPHWVREIPGNGRSGKLIDGYEIRPTMGYMATELGVGWFPGMSGGGQAVFRTNEVIAIKYPSPVSYTDGYSPLSAIAPWIDCSANIDASRVYAFKNNAFPGVVIEIDADMADPSPEEIERIKARIEAEWQGVRNNKRPVILAAGMKMVPFAQNTAQEMEYHLSADQMCGNILAAYGISKSMAGLTESTTYANADAAKLNFYRGRMKPKLSLIGQVLSPWAQEAYDDETLEVYWPDPTPEDPELELRRQDQDLRTGVTFVNEVREERGKEPYKFGGNNPTMAMGVHEIAWNDGEEDQAMQAMDQQGAAAQGGMPGMPGMPAPGEEDPTQMGQDVPDDYDIQNILGGGAAPAGAAAPPMRQLPNLSGGKAATNGRR